MKACGDTLRHTLFRIDWSISEDKPTLEERAVARERGLPDGSCNDEDGLVWNAH